MTDAKSCCRMICESYLIDGIKTSSYIQKQPFTDSLRNSYYQKYCKIHRKISAMEFFLFFNKVADLDLQHFTEKRVSLQIYSCELSDASKNIFFTECLRATASVY